MKEYDKTDLQIKRLFDALKTETDEHEFTRKTMRSLPNRQSYLRPIVLTLSFLTACGLSLLLNRGIEFDFAACAATIEKGSAALASFLITLPENPLRAIVVALAITLSAAYGSHRYIERI